MKKAALLILVILPLLILFVFLFRSQIYKISFPSELHSIYRKELTTLAQKALETNDVPVAALLLYDGKIIGRGYNTVLRYGNAGGHAEINAISDAISSMGMDNFKLLDRNKLIILSTFEPCPMCIGAIREYKIKYVEFLKEKPLGYWHRHYLGEFFYELKKKQIDGSILQDSLFLEHRGNKDTL